MNCSCNWLQRSLPHCIKFIEREAAKLEPEMRDREQFRERRNGNNRVGRMNGVYVNAAIAQNGNLIYRTSGVADILYQTF